MKKEIKHELRLSEEQRLLLHMHSFLNITSILRDELMRLRELSGRDSAFEGCLQVVNNIYKSLGDDSPAMITPHQMHEFHSYIEQEIAAEFGRAEYPENVQDEIRESIRNLRSLFSIMHARVRELLARQREREDWNPHSVAYLRQSITSFLEALAINSKGSFGIVFDAKEKKGNDYFVQIEIQSSEGAMITMPGVFSDCFRDLIANSRKYTAPGGTIRALLADDDEKIILDVSDDGMGIPSGELERVVEFGYRAKNVRHIETKGGGFGLTRLYYETKKHGGRMWIDSSPDKGTNITAHIPKKY